MFGPGLLAGLVAALSMILVMLLLRWALGVPSAAELIPDRIAPLLPVEAFLTLLGLVGGYNQLKQLGVGSVLAGQLLVGAGIGWLYAGIVERGRARDPWRTWHDGISRQGVLAVALLVGLLWLSSLALLRPVLGTSYRGLPPGTAGLVTAFGLLVSYAVYGASLLVLYLSLTRRQEPRHAETDERIKRRAVVVGGLGVVVALASGALLRRLSQLAVFSYDGLEYRGPDLQPLAPNDRFYVVTKNVIDPSVAPDDWRLELGGMVERPRAYRFEDLAAMPALTQETTLMCISNEVGGGLISNAVWKGVPLRSLLDPAGPKPGVVEVLLHGADSYTDTIAFEKALEPTTLVVWEMNGEPLPERHGYPVRVIVPGLFGEKNVKWVTRIELVDHDAKGFYEQQGWGPSFVIPTRSRFTAPDFGQPLRPGGPIALQGTAFGGDRGVAGVEVSLDGGRTWQGATLAYPGSRLSWALWSYDWRPAGSGEYDLVVRTTDGSGTLQTPERRGTVPEGATGYHRVKARVEN